MEKTPMSDEEFNALKIVCNMFERMVNETDIQNGNYPYLMATSVDLDRHYGKEARIRA